MRTKVTTHVDISICGWAQVHALLCFALLHSTLMCCASHTAVLCSLCCAVSQKLCCTMLCRTHWQQLQSLLPPCCTARLINIHLHIPFFDPSS